MQQTNIITFRGTTSPVYNDIFGLSVEEMFSFTIFTLLIISSGGFRERHGTNLGFPRMAWHVAEIDHDIR